MANDKPYYDSLTSFEAGVNSGVEPILLPKNQLSFAINATVRGGHLATRPPFNKLTIDFGDDSELRAIIEGGFFQGAGHYRPDYGPSEIVAQIGGRLFAFTISGDTCTAREITIVGDANDSSTTQVWMWQAEKWLIINDGSGKLPIFYNGVSCRRSTGPSQTLVAVGDILTALPAAPPGIGESVVLTLNTTYTGSFDISVLFNGSIYQTVGALTDNIALTNVSETVGTSIPSGTDIIVNPNLLGYITTPTSSSAAIISNISCAIPAYCQCLYRMTINLVLTSVGTATVGESITVDTSSGSKSFTIATIFGNTLTVYRDEYSSVSPVSGVTTPPPPAAISVAADALVQFSSSKGPTVILGQLTAAFVTPAVGTTVFSSMNVSYTGPASQLVTINGNLHLINSVPVSGGTTLNLINLTDTDTANYDDPAGVPTKPISSLDIVTLPELPAGRMGAYGMGRVWMSLTDGISYIAGDIVGGASGTVANNYRDAILNTTENDYLAGGGTFRLPGAGQIINAMWFTAVLDTALGQGNLLIGTDTSIFSCNTPVDRATWEDIQNPIQTEALKGFGPLAQNSTVLANSDTIFRSVQGLGSLIMARRNFGEGSWGNTPISREMERTFKDDNRSLLSYGSSVVFDNRLIASAAPQVSGTSVFHAGAAVMNFDLLSNLRGKAPPVWEGLWTGINVVQNVTGLFTGVNRAFAFGFNITETKTELYEFLPSVSSQKFDNNETKIVMVAETCMVFRNDVKPLEDLAQLFNGELYLKDIVGEVEITVKFRPDWYPCWRTWRTLTVCADNNDNDTHPGYQSPVTLGEPTDEACESANNLPFRMGHMFQFRIEVTGVLKLMAMRFAARPVPEADFSQPLCSPTCGTELPIP